MLWRRLLRKFIHLRNNVKNYANQRQKNPKHTFCRNLLIKSLLHKKGLRKSFLLRKLNSSTTLTEIAVPYLLTRELLNLFGKLGEVVIIIRIV